MICLDIADHYDDFSKAHTLATRLEIQFTKISASNSKKIHNRSDSLDVPAH